MPRISVTGTGTMTAYPDEADIMFSVRTQDSSAAKAAAENGVQATAVFASLAALGVNKSDIRTISYSLSPAYDSYNYSQVVGYVAVNSMEVIVTGTETLPNVGKIVDAVVQAGANQVDGISFTFTDPNYNTLANPGVSEGGSGRKLTSISDSYWVRWSNPRRRFSIDQLRLRDRPSTPSHANTGGAKQPTPINSGPQQVTATVNITYLYL